MSDGKAGQVISKKERVKENSAKQATVARREINKQTDGLRALCESARGDR